MSLGKLILIGVLTLPFAEIAVFVAVASAVGFLPAFLALLAASAAGIALLARAGRNLLKATAETLAERNVARFEIDPGGFLSVLAGLLLAMPGFITGAVGLLLLIGPVRRKLAAALTTRAGRGAKAVDLGPEEWRRVPERQLGGPEEPRGGDGAPRRNGDGR